MLPQAIKVIEAIRKLDLHTITNYPGRVVVGSEKRHLNGILNEIYFSLQEFDKASSVSRDPSIALVRVVRHALQSGIPADELANVVSSGSDEEDLRDLNLLAELKPQPGDIGPPDKISDSSPVPAPRLRPEDGGADISDKYLEPEPTPVPEQILPNSTPDFNLDSKAAKNIERKVAVAAGSVAVLENAPKLAPSFDRLATSYVLEYGREPNSSLMVDGFTARDGAEELDSISDQLEFAVARFGWTPRLQILAGAFIKAMRKAAMRDQELAFSADDLSSIQEVKLQLAQIEHTPEFAYDDPNDHLPKPVYK